MWGWGVGLGVGCGDGVGTNYYHAHHETADWLSGLRYQGRQQGLGVGWGWGRGYTIYMPISNEGSGMPTTRLQTGSLV